MANIKIAIINQYPGLSDAEVRKVVNALQVQVRRDFAPVWGIDADLTFYPKGTKAPATSWQLVILDNSDAAGALGYHDITKSGLPLGKVFAGTDKQYGSAWSVTASHELLEMLGDPDINLTTLVEYENGEATLYAYEVCDACEDDSFGYKIDGVLVSDFVLPAWFESFHQHGPHFDYRKKITKPFQLLKGGYIGIYQIRSGTGWTQLTAQGSPLHYKARPHVGSRRERRRTPRHQWITSKAS